LWILFLNLAYNIAVYSFAATAYLYRSEAQVLRMLQNSAESGGFALNVSFGFTLFNIALNFFVFVNVVYLIYVHIWLQCKGLTTYEYILDKIVKEELKKEETLEKKNENNKSENAVLKIKSSNYNNKYPFGSDNSFYRKNSYDGNNNNKNNNSNNNNKNNNNNNNDDYKDNENIIETYKNNNHNTNKGEINIGKEILNGAAAGDKIRNKKIIDVNYCSTKKGKNKIMPENLIQIIQQNNYSNSNNNSPINGISLKENSDKIIIEGKDYQEKLFKPIVDEIYNLSKNVKRVNVVPTSKKSNFYLKTNANKQIKSNSENENLKFIKQALPSEKVNNLNNYNNKSLSPRSNSYAKNNKKKYKKNEILAENILNFNIKEIGDTNDFNVIDSCKAANDFENNNNNNYDLNKCKGREQQKTNRSNRSSFIKNFPSNNHMNNIINNTNFLRQSTINEFNNSMLIKEK